MTQRHLDRAVARATGESVATIRRLGFGLAGPPALAVRGNRPRMASTPGGEGGPPWPAA